MATLLERVEIAEAEKAIALQDNEALKVQLLLVVLITMSLSVNQCTVWCKKQCLRCAVLLLLLQCTACSRYELLPYTHQRFMNLLNCHLTVCCVLLLLLVPSCCASRSSSTNRYYQHR